MSGKRSNGTTVYNTTSARNAGEKEEAKRQHKQIAGRGRLLDFLYNPPLCPRLDTLEPIPWTGSYPQIAASKVPSIYGIDSSRAAIQICAITSVGPKEILPAWWLTSSSA